MVLFLDLDLFFKFAFFLSNSAVVIKWLLRRHYFSIDQSDLLRSWASNPHSICPFVSFGGGVFEPGGQPFHPLNSQSSRISLICSSRIKISTTSPTLTMCFTIYICFLNFFFYYNVTCMWCGLLLKKFPLKFNLLCNLHLMCFTCFKKCFYVTCRWCVLLAF